MRRRLNALAGVVVILAIIPLWLLWPLLALLVYPNPPTCLDGPCVWTARDGPKPLLAHEEFWLLCLGGVTLLMLLAGVRAIAKNVDWKRLRTPPGERRLRRPAPIDFGSALREGRVAATELSARTVAAGPGTAHILWSLQGGAVAVATVSSLVARPTADALHADILVALALGTLLSGSACLLGLARGAPEPFVLAAWASSLTCSLSASFLLGQLAPPEAMLGPLVGVVALAGHAAGVAALAIGRRAPS